MTEISAGRLGERSLDRSPLAEVPVMADELPDEPRAVRIGFAETLQDDRCLVGEAVVHHDHLDAFELGTLLQHLQPLERGGDQELLVVDGNEDRERGDRRWSRRRSGPELIASAEKVDSDPTQTCFPPRHLASAH